jgi:predicted phosphodiesterase
MERLLIAGVGDIHGRFHRVREWLSELEKNRRRRIDLVFAVGDVEAFAQAEDHRRKAAKRNLPAEYADYAAGAASLGRPMYFIAGNNEDFAALHPIQGGGVLPGPLHYLGRAGVVEISGLRVGYLSGIFAPKHFATPLEAPVNREKWKQSGYFRKEEVDKLLAEKPVDILLLHEWPKGLVPRGSRAGGPALRAARFPWIGNLSAKALCEALRPAWVLCGHSHVPLATSLHYSSGAVTRISCLDQASRADGALIWMDWEKDGPSAAGWGTSGAPAWAAGQPWDYGRTPESNEAADS